MLESASLSARAYIETWLLVVVGGVFGKLLVDTIRDPEAEGVAWHVLPFAIVSLLVLVDIVRLRRKLGSVRMEEDADLARQRELRTLLGLDEVQLPLDGPATGPEA